MRAALLARPGVITIDDVPDPTVGPDDVRIAVGGVGLCGSDLSVFHGRWDAPSYPWIMGHEAFGTVEAVGEAVPRSRLGEVVVVEPNVACLSCSQCRRGRTSACVRRQSVGMNRAGALAEKLVVPSEFAWRIDGPSPADLVCVEPLTVAEAALRRLGPASLPGSAMVVGVGPQGLLMSLALLRRGVRVHVDDPQSTRVELATTLGAEAGEDPEARFDLVVDSVGTPRSIETALGRVEIGGTLLVLGLDSRPFELSAQLLVRRQLVLRGSLTYDHPVDFRATVQLVEAGEVAPSRIITEQYPLAAAQQAFESSESARGKTWIQVADPSAST
ncbi:MAG TPA: alcohol dehydrogenase catalytic domain-containing protein [Candidatus Limnocylindrales bacterium]|nr:alcohol dehydrogenase catalytic domain-containing protein [Candidatus Limnocylindrales bacterium]